MLLVHSQIEFLQIADARAHMGHFINRDRLAAGGPTCKQRHHGEQNNRGCSNGCGLGSWPGTNAGLTGSGALRRWRNLDRTVGLSEHSRLSASVDPSEMTGMKLMHDAIDHLNEIFAVMPVTHPGERLPGSTSMVDRWHGEHRSCSGNRPQKKRTTTKSVLRPARPRACNNCSFEECHQLGRPTVIVAAIDEFVDWYCSESRLAFPPGRQFLGTVHIGNPANWRPARSIYVVAR